MKTAKLTVVLLAAAIILLLAVPTLRHAAWEAYRRSRLSGTQVWPTQEKLENIMQAHANSPQIWLGLAQSINARKILSQYHPRLGEEPPPWTPEQAYQQAIALSPEAPAPYLRYALYLLANSGELGREEEGGVGRKEEPRRTAAQTANLRQAEGLLQKARQLQPDNAACDYLLGYIYLAQHNDDQVFAALQAAVGKPYWNVANTEAVTATLALMDAASIPGTWAPRLANAQYAHSELSILPKLCSYARTLVGLAEELRKQGKHERATVYYQATLHLGHVMRANAYSLVEGLVAVAATNMASTPFLSEADRQEIVKKTPITEDQEERERAAGALMDAMLAQAEHPEDDAFRKFFREEAKRDAAKSEAQRRQEEQAKRQRQERERRMQEARVANFTDYLRRNGRADLASSYEADVEAAARWKERTSEVLDGIMGQMLATFYGGTLRHAWVVWSQAAAFLALCVIVGLISLGTRYWRQPRAYLRWSYWQWLLLLAIVIIGGQILATTTKFQMIDGTMSPTDMAYFIAIPVSAGIGIAAWLALALVLALRKRASQGNEVRLGKARTYLASLRTLLPPTLAAFMVLSVIGLWPLHENSQYWEREQRTMIEQGDVQYWELGSTSEEPTSSQLLRRLQPMDSGKPSGSRPR